MLEALKEDEGSTFPCPLLSPGVGCWAGDGQGRQSLNAKAALGWAGILAIAVMEVWFLESTQETLGFMAGRGRKSIWEGGKGDTRYIPRKKGFGHGRCGAGGGPRALCTAPHCWGRRAQVMGPSGMCSSWGQEGK